jgi:hypothetical protein
MAAVQPCQLRQHYSSVHPMAHVGAASENYYGIRDPGILVERVFIPSLLVSKRVALNIKEFI